MHTNRKQSNILIGAAVGATACVAAARPLNIDIRATGVNGAGLVLGQTSKLIAVVDVGDVIAFDIFATVTGSNASTADDKFISVSGSWKSSPFGRLGNVSVEVVRSVMNPDGTTTLGFDGTGFSVGLQQDLDGDGDLDVGSNNDSVDQGFWSARYPATDGLPSNWPTGRKIGYGTFTVTSNTMLTYVNFDGRNSSFAANYVQDGFNVSEPSQDGAFPLQIGFGTPEPGTAGLLGLVGLAGLAVRRR